MQTYSLNGLWQCELPDGRKLDVTVPGCWDTYTPEKNIGGKVIMSRRFNWQTNEETTMLCFGAVSYYCDIYINGYLAGSHEGMWDTFHVNVTPYLISGENQLTLHIWKPGYEKEDRFPLREVLSGFIPDVRCTFGGIWEDVYLETAGNFFVTHHNGQGTYDGLGSIEIALDMLRQGNISVEIDILSGDAIVATQSGSHGLMPGDQSISFPFVLQNPTPWQMDQPFLYQYVLRISTANTTQTLTGHFGLRTVDSDGTQILLNQSPVYLRGILHWGYYDELIPRPSEATIEKEISDVRQYGFNMIKHCLYIPSEAYLQWADRTGTLLWIELPIWLQEPHPELENRIRREYPRLLSRLKGHPSIVMISLACELDDTLGASILKDMYHLVKENMQVLVRDNSGSGECYGGLAIDFADFFDYHFYADLQNFEPLAEAFTPTWRNRRPWLFGEFCDSDTLRDFQRIKDKKGDPAPYWLLDDPVKNPISKLKSDFFAGNHDQQMEKYGIRAEYDLLQQLSYNHSMAHRKLTLEMTRSFPEICGYNITSIRDVEIATSGMFDDFMQPKFDPGEFSKFNGDLALLPAWDLSRIWVSADRVQPRERFSFPSGFPYSLHILLSNYSGQAIEGKKLRWRLIHGDQTLQSGILPMEHLVEHGDVQEIAYLYFDLPVVKSPQAYTLHVILDDMDLENSWPVFVYPPLQNTDAHFTVFDPQNIFTGIGKVFKNAQVVYNEDEIGQPLFLITSQMTASIHQYIQDGGKALCLQRGKGFLPVEDVAFWREGMLRSYPTSVSNGLYSGSIYDNLRWFSLATDTAFDNEKMAEKGFALRQPILRRYDCRRWNSHEYFAEYQCGNGQIFASTLRFEGGMGKQPLFFSGNFLAQHLLDSVITVFQEDPVHK